MPGYILSPRALADLDDIWDYSVQRWGEGQAETYVGNIRTALDNLVEHPQRRRACNDIRSGYFKVAVGSHVIFYRVADTSLDVKRILHQRMDFDQHL